MNECDEKSLKAAVCARLTIKRTWLSVAGATVIPLAAAGSASLQSTIVQNGAPIAIDRCAVVLSAVDGVGRNTLSEDVGFSNVSQRTVTQVRFKFKIVDASGLTEGSVTGDKLGEFAPGIAINDSNGTPAGRDYMRQTVDALPHVTEVLCSVQMVRFDDGSIWHEGDGPAGNAVISTPLPGPTPTTQWQWPYDPPTP